MYPEIFREKCSEVLYKAFELLQLTASIGEVGVGNQEVGLYVHRNYGSTLGGASGPITTG